MNTVTLTGREAWVRWGYHTAATLQSWTITADPTGGSVTGVLADVDAFKVSQQPLMFVVPRQNGQSWSWPLDSLAINGADFTARVRVQEG